MDNDETCRVALRDLKKKLRQMWPYLNERGRRLLASAEALQAGYGGVSLVSRACGLSRKTIAEGIKELTQAPLSEHGISSARQPRRIRRPGGGRKLKEVKDPAIVPTLERLLKDQNEIGGDPMTEQKWVRSSLRRLSGQLAAEGHPASVHTVGRLLREMGFSLKANQRKQGRSGCPERDEQFRLIAAQKQCFISGQLAHHQYRYKKEGIDRSFQEQGEDVVQASGGGQRA